MRRTLCIALVTMFLASCQQGPFYEKNTVIPGQLWEDGFKPEFEVDIKEAKSTYELYFNTRHTAYYPYSNFSFLLRAKGKGLADSSLRYELKLAEGDGRWIGGSAGNLYEQSQLLSERFTFPDTGKYVFSIEQNMSDNPLRGINDVGIKLIKK